MAKLYDKRYPGILLLKHCGTPDWILASIKNSDFRYPPERQERSVRILIFQVHRHRWSPPTFSCSSSYRSETYLRGACREVGRSSVLTPLLRRMQEEIERWKLEPDQFLRSS